MIPGIDEPERLLGRADAPIGSSYHISRASKNILAQEPNILDELRRGFKNCGGENAENVYEDIEIEYKKLELICDELKRWNTGFKTLLPAQRYKTIAAEMEKPTS